MVDCGNVDLLLVDYYVGRVVDNSVDYYLWSIGPIVQESFYHMISRAPLVFISTVFYDHIVVWYFVDVIFKVVI